MRKYDESQNVNTGKGYVEYQFAKAFNRAISVQENETKSQALKKLRQWQEVLSGIDSGIIEVGSRTPVNVPEWVTLEVVTGGFTTGEYLAGGEIQEFEIQLIQKFGLKAAKKEVRRTLNAFFLTEKGLEYIYNLYSTGCYKINVPEEGALLTIAWLLSKDLILPAGEIIDEIIPFFDSL
ncbi:MAG TPA: hypothetical protein VF941_09635, partial [Clostridia bacterium]